MILLIPAIDLLGGKCVRLWQGSYTRETVYYHDPAKMAKLWRVQNARVLHVVDLDAARGDQAAGANNRAAIGRICEALDIPVQVGGGMRTIGDIEAALTLGVSRVILGTAAVRNPDLVSEAVRRFTPGRIAVGIDAKDGEVRVDGWTAGSGVDAVELATSMEVRGIRRIIYTDISRDGTMEGPNVEAYRTLCRHLKRVHITASGGVGGFQDLMRLNALQDEGIDSVIVGRSLYENAFPCQKIWCWNYKERVDLDGFSSANEREP